MTDETQTETEISVEDRIASKFEEAPQEEATQAPDFEEVEWQGEKYQIPAKLKSAFMQHDDYTRKTQDLAEQRRSMEHNLEVSINAQLDRTFFDTTANERQELAVIDAYLQQAGKVDWGSMPTDQMIRQKMELDSIKERREQINRSIESKRTEFNDKFNSKVKELRGKAREIASKSINGFSEETEAAVRKFAQAEGLSDVEIDNVLLDPRSYKILWKALQFDQVKAGTARVTEKTAKVLKPGAASERMPAKVAVDLNYRKEIKAAKTSGEKANAIERRLANVFQPRM